MIQFHKCRKREMMSSIRLQHYDVTSCKQRHLIEKIYWCKGVSTCYNHRKFGKVSFITEGVIAFSKKVHVFLETPCICDFSCLQKLLKRRREKLQMTCGVGHHNMLIVNILFKISIFPMIGKKNNQSSASDADQETPNPQVNE